VSPVSRRAEVLLLVLVMALVVVLALPGFLVGEVLYLRDSSLYYWPTKHFFGSCLQAGDFPHWFGGTYNGQPFLVNPRSSLLYPPQLAAYWLLPPIAAFNVMVCLHLVLLGVGAGQWLRRVWKSSALTATVGGISLTLSGFTLSSVEFHNHLLTLAWLPWALLAAAALARSPGAGAVARLAVICGLMILAGEPYILIIVGGLLVAQVAYGRSWQSMAGLVVAGVMAILLAAPQILPTLLHLPRTTRVADANAGLRPDQFALVPAQLLELVIPHFTGRPDQLGDWQRAAFGDISLYATLYPGAAVLMLALTGLVCGRRRLVLILGSLGLVLTTTPLGKLLAYLPLVSMVRFRAKWFLLAALALVIAATEGLEMIRTRRDAAKVLLVAGLFVIVVSGAAMLLEPVWQDAVTSRIHSGNPLTPHAAVAGIRSSLQRLQVIALIIAMAALAAMRRRRQLAVLLLVGVIAGDLLLIAPMTNPTAPAALVHDPGPVVSAASSLARGHRVWRHPQSALTALTARDLSAVWLGVRIHRTAKPLSGVQWGLDYAFDDDVDRMVDTAASAVCNRELTPDVVTRILRLSGVSHVIADEPVLPALTRVVSDPVSGISLYSLDAPVPRLRLLEHARIADSADQRYQMALATDHDPTLYAIVEGKVPGPPAETDQGWEPGATARVKSVAETSDSLTAEYLAPGNAWLVWLQTPAPGWRAAIDGKAVAIYPADAGAMAVQVPAGRHTLVFTYTPPGFKTGLLLAGVAGLILCVGLVLERHLASRSKAAALSDGISEAS
jgi:hypothetical protein